MQVAKCLLTAVVGAALGLSQRQAPIPGYNITTLEWNVQVGNETITIPGTVEKVMAHLDVHHPEHAAEIHKAAAANFQMTQSSSSSPLVRRTNYSMGYTYCDLGTPVATIGDISQGIAYLNTVRGSPTNGPGPNNCGQVSCAYDSAIWWCNQNAYTYSIDSFEYIGVGAQYIIAYCLEDLSNVNGEQYLYDSTDASKVWSVIVVGEPDNCNPDN